AACTTSRDWTIRWHRCGAWPRCWPMCVLSKFGTGFGYLVAGACLALGTASHQASVMVLPFLLCWSWVRGETLRQMLPPMAILGALLALEMHLLLQITDVDGATTSVSLHQLLTDSPLTMIPAVGRVLLWLVGRLFTTAHWIFFPLYQLQSWEYYFGGLVLLGLAALAYYRMRDLAIWSAWIVLSLVPFILVSEEIHLHLVHGPSRHLYMASAGSSVLLAWGLQQVGCALVKRLATWGYVAYGVALIAVCLSGYANLKRTEALSHYATGRFYITLGDTEMGIKQLQKAIAKGHDMIPLIDAYQRLGLLLPYLGRDALPLLQRGVLEFPESLGLNAFLAVLEQEQDDRNLRNLGQRRGTQVYAQAGPLKQDLNQNISALYHNLGVGYMAKKHYSKAVSAFTKALDLQPQKQSTAKMLKKAHEKASVPN
ncbi:MAG: tetratricopeptide (TPR) repeat protein, partial [Candidatus Latescibacterota bacterium]